MATPRSTRNNASGTLGAGYTAGSGSFTLAAGHGARFAGSKWPIYVTAVENPGPGETVKGVFSVTGVSSDTLQGVLAADGTTDVNVANGATVECRPTRQHVDDLIDACTGALAATGGTMSNVAVTASLVNSTPVGGTTPAAGAFTTLSSTGNAALGQCFTVTAAGGGVVNVTSTVTNVVLNASSYVFQVTSSAGIFLNGSVGIGTGAPLRALHVSGASSSQAVEMLFRDTDQTVNNRQWAVGMSGSSLAFRAAQDSPSFGSTVFTVNRNGTASLAGSLTAGGLAVNTSSGFIFAVSPGNYANDAAAAAGGVGVGQVYRNGSVLMIRVS
jgi:hypothetical protein